MTNTIPNVPRELLERAWRALANSATGREIGAYLDADPCAPECAETCARASRCATCSADLSAPSSANHVEDVRAMVAAPSTAGVDGLEVETYLHTMHMELGQTEQFCSKWKGDPFGVLGVDYSSTYSVTSEPLCRLSDAQSIIDGLRGEVADLLSMLATVSKAGLRVRTDRDQQAQRISELEGLLRSIKGQLSGRANIHDRIGAALSAGKEGE